MNSSPFPPNANPMPTPPDAREQLSALMDGELDKDAIRFLLKRCEGDADLGGCWQRWHVAGEVMRGGQVVPVRIDLVSAVSLALAQEGHPVVAGGAGRSTLRRSALQWGGGFAVAASVALAALIVVRPAAAPESTLAANVPAAQAVAPISAVAVATVAPSALREQDLLPPHRFLDAQTVSNDGMPHRYLGFDPRIESYLRRENGLRLQPQALQSARLPLVAPVREATPEPARELETVD